MGMGRGMAGLCCAPNVVRRGRMRWGIAGAWAAGNLYRIGRDKAGEDAGQRPSWSWVYDGQGGRGRPGAGRGASMYYI